MTMREIRLTNGRGIALVDDEDFERVNAVRWLLHNDGYASRTYWYYPEGVELIYANRRCKYITMQRFILGEKDGLHIDHINRNRLDNRKENLRFVTPAQNIHNSVRKPSKHGFIGVHKREGEKKYSMKIRVGAKNINEYGFDTPQEAARRYNELALKYRGEFAVLNAL